MLQSIVIGNLGADAKLNNSNGKEFTSFRVAHTDRWKDEAGQEHSNTIWVDCILNGKPAVVEYLKQGTQVCVIGNTSTRIYSSEKDRCMKAGIQIAVRSIELLGGLRDAVPSRLYDKDGVQHDVQKFYHTDVLNAQLMTTSGKLFATDANGWVLPVASQTDNSSSSVEQTNQQDEVF